MKFKNLVFSSLLLVHFIPCIAQVSDSVRYEIITLDTIKSVAPTVTSKTVDDSGDFNIMLSDNSLSVIYKKQKLPVYSMSDLDSYFKKNIKMMTKTQIVVKSSSQLKSDYFVKMMKLLQKYNLHHFSVVALQS